MLECDHELDFYLNNQLSAVHWLDRLGRDVLATGGKRFRARLTLKLAECFQVSRERALPWAAATEMLHNASLVHDDIQDRDLWRRGKPTLWSEHGMEVAIAAGDYLLMKPFLIVAQIPTGETIRYQLGQWIAQTVASMAVAQVDERRLLEHLSAPDLGRRYLEVVQGKTSSLFELPVRGISLLAGHAEDLREEARLSFSRLGQCFQILDDLKDILGLKGKPNPGEDLREGKVSAVVVSYAKLRPAGLADLARFLSLPPERKTAADIASWVNEFSAVGATAATVNWVEEQWSGFRETLPTKLAGQGIAECVRPWLHWEGLRNV